MLLTRFLPGALSVWITMAASMVSSQDYPNRPIRIVTGTSGGASDFTARLVAQGISGPLGQAVVVDNRAGSLPDELVSKAPPDGYTLLLDGSSFWIGPLLQKMSYDAVKDFSPVTKVLSQPNVLVVHPSVSAKSVKELIALAKAKPGELNYASGGEGGIAHLAAELFKSMSGVNIVRINYKGSGPAVSAIIGGEVQLMFPNAAAVTAHLKSGRLSALAVTSLQPSPLFPGLPTVAASGVPGYELVSALGVFAPAKTPAPIVNRLNQEIARFVHTPEVKEKFFNNGAEAAGGSPEDLAASVQGEITKASQIIKDAGIHVN